MYIFNGIQVWSWVNTDSLVHHGSVYSGVTKSGTDLTTKVHASLFLQFGFDYPEQEEKIRGSRSYLEGNGRMIPDRLNHEW